MRVLDIDLDFFLADCCPLAAPGERPALCGHEPWSDHEVKSYLQINLGLDPNQKIPGRIFDTHDKALLFWQEKIAEGRLTVPFSVIHVDAHSDLGIGKPGPGYVLNTVLAQSCDKRTESGRHYAMKQLDEANYLLFALAYRWVDTLYNIRNIRSRRDIPKELYHDGKDDRIRLSSFTSVLMENRNGIEPIVPFIVYDDPYLFVNHEPFDFITVAISPRYSPEEADGLIPVFQQYIDPE